jgi:hypothetical protein
MIESLVLIEGAGVKEENLRISLANAKQLVIGSAPGYGVILHIAATTPNDLGKALLKFAKVPDVSGVLTLMLRNQQ